MNSTPADFIASAASYALAAAGTFLRETPEQATLDTSALAPPFIVLGEYTTSQVRLESRVSAAAITLYFADARPGPGDSPAAHQDALRRMEALRQSFVASLDASYLVALDSIKFTPFTSAYAAQLDGIGMSFTLTVPMTAPIPACLPGFVPYVPGPVAVPYVPPYVPLPAPQQLAALSAVAS